MGEHPYDKRTIPVAGERDTVVIHLRIPNELNDLLEADARSKGYTGRAEYVRNAIRNELGR